MVSTILNDRKRTTAAGLAILRVTVGVVFLAHGLQKATEWGWRGGVPFFAEAGIPLAGIAAPLVLVAEIACGGALVLGLGSRIASLVLALVMAVALITVHLPHGFFLPSGFEFVLVLGACNITIMLAGPGKPSLDRCIADRRTAGRSSP